MPRNNGIEKARHFAFRKFVQTRPYGMGFTCSYVTRGNPVHARTYCWFRAGNPVKALIGSANYSLTAFGMSQIEAMSDGNAQSVATFYSDLRRNATGCLNEGIEVAIAVTETRQVSDNDGETVTLSLLDRRTGETPARSGINWGQRDGRDRNQACINIPGDIRKSGFFPECAEQFTVLTDDGDSFIMVTAQDGGIRSSYNAKQCLARRISSGRNAHSFRSLCHVPASRGIWSQGCNFHQD